MVENLEKWREGPQQITRLVQDGPPQLMVENLGKCQEGPHCFLRTTNKTAPLGATKIILKNKIPITFSFIIVFVLDSFYFVLFCIINHGGRLIHELSKNIIVSGLKNGGRLIHEKYGTRFILLKKKQNRKKKFKDLKRSFRYM